MVTVTRIGFYKWRPSASHLHPLTLSAQWKLQLWVPKSSHHGPGHWLPKQVGEDGAQDNLPGLGGKKAEAQEYMAVEFKNYGCLEPTSGLKRTTYLSLEQI